MVRTPLKLTQEETMGRSNEKALLFGWFAFISLVDYDFTVDWLSARTSPDKGSNVVSISIGTERNARSMKNAKITSRQARNIIAQMIFFYRLASAM